jgi:hypothetical protein
MKFISLLRRPVNCRSLLWHDSQAIKGVRFATRRASLAQRLELARRIRELTLRYEFLKSGEPADQMEATLSDLLANKLYVEWGLAQMDGLLIDGRPATTDRLIDKGPSELVDEIIEVIRSGIGLSDDERKNS